MEIHQAIKISRLTNLHVSDTYINTIEKSIVNRHIIHIYKIYMGNVSFIFIYNKQIY